MKITSLILAAPIGAALVSDLLAEISVFAGDDLQAVVAAAPDGELITIHSDAVFSGSLAWTGKGLTVRSAPGFAPTIVGDTGLPALNFASFATGVRGDFKGLTIVPGANSGNRAARLEASGVGILAEFSFEDCVLMGELVQTCIGTFPFELDLNATDVQGLCLVGGGGATTVNFQVLDGSSIELLALAPRSASSLAVLMEDSRVEFGFAILAKDDAATDCVFRRVHLGGSSAVWEDGPGAVAEVLMESCLLQGPGTGRGLHAYDGAQLRGVNLTISGYVFGLDAEAGCEFVNLAVFGNGTDIVAGMAADQVRTSLIEDGTFDGLFGNFSGTPEVNAEYALVAGSIGIDAGDSSAADLGTLDLFGNDRIQDGDGDGLARVNVGASESAAVAIKAASAPINGSGTNPSVLTVTQAPALGAQFTADIATDAATVLTVLALGSEAGAPAALPGLTGELLLGLDTPILLFTSPGSHVLDVPNSPALYGKVLACQALTLQSSAGGFETVAGDGALLTLGGL